jgi:hypothetical protein
MKTLRITKIGWMVFFSISLALRLAMHYVGKAAPQYEMLKIAHQCAAWAGVVAALINLIYTLRIKH